MSILTGDADGGRVCRGQYDRPCLICRDEGDGPHVAARRLDGEERPVAARRVDERDAIVAVGGGRVHDQCHGPGLAVRRHAHGAVRLHGYQLPAVAPGYHSEAGPEVLQRRHYRRQARVRVQHLRVDRQVQLRRCLLLLYYRRRYCHFFLKSESRFVRISAGSTLMSVRANIVILL